MHKEPRRHEERRRDKETDRQGGRETDRQMTKHASGQNMNINAHTSAKHTCASAHAGLHAHTYSPNHARTQQQAHEQTHASLRINRGCAPAVQTLVALKFMHSADLLHRDMKPSNLLLNSDCLMKASGFLCFSPLSISFLLPKACRFIFVQSFCRTPFAAHVVEKIAQRCANLCMPCVQVADFGLARSMTEVNNVDVESPILTDYVATRWYNYPEPKLTRLIAFCLAPLACTRCAGPIDCRCSSVHHKAG
eukprot:1534564-Pleurochrysis_carterae.AAC.6